jgi:hypothetical protein
MSAYCPDCGVEAEPFRDGKGKHLAIDPDPKRTRSPRNKRPAYYCRECDRVFCERVAAPVDDYDDRQKRAAGEPW